MHITVNEKVYDVPDGAGVSVTDKGVFVNGQKVPHGVKSEILIKIEGGVANIRADVGSVEVRGDVTGDIRCGGSVKVVQGVSGSVHADGTAEVGGNVGGDVIAGGNVTCGKVAGNIEADGSVTETG